MIEASAPGKLVLLGEFAVLAGGTALAAAVDRRVQVSLNPSDRWSVRSAGPAESSGEFEPLPNTSASNPKFALIESVLEEFQRFVGRELPAHSIEIDSSALYDAGSKLGLGSSAAAAASLLLALDCAANLKLDPAVRFRLGHAAHSRAQGGRGSGVDVAASTFGGLIGFRQPEEIIPLNWPNGLGLIAVKTGEGSSTVGHLSRMEAFRKSDPKQFDLEMGRLVELSERVPTDILDAEEFMGLADDYFQALAGFDRKASIGIVTSEHLRLRELASKFGAVFKTSGAGGGDLGLIFAKLELLDQVRSAIQESGVVVVPVPISPSGARIEAA